MLVCPGCQDAVSEWAELCQRCGAALEDAVSVSGSNRRNRRPFVAAGVVVTVASLVGAVVWAAGQDHHGDVNATASGVTESAAIHRPTLPLPAGGQQTTTASTTASITLPDGVWFNQIEARAGSLVLIGTLAGLSSQPVCAAAEVGTQTFGVGKVTTVSCDSPELGGAQVAPVGSYIRGTNNATLSIARLDPHTGRVSVGPVVMTYGSYSDSRPLWAYGGGSLWIYDVDSTHGPEALQVSASTGQVETTVSMPQLYRPILAANGNGLWIGNSMQGSTVSDVLYHAAPGSTTATGVLASTGGEHMFWLVGSGEHLWAGIGPIFTEQSIWRFDGPNAHPAFHVPDRGFAPTAVVGDVASGLWTVGPHPPQTTVPTAPYPDQEVVRIDPNTGEETMITTLRGIPIPTSLLGGTTLRQLAYFQGSLYVSEPPFRANGYLGFSTLIRITPSAKAGAGSTPSG